MIMKFISRIDNKEVTVNTSESFKYGIMLSGGLDSALLFYLMLKDCPTAQIQSFYIAKHDGSHLYIQGIIDYLESLFQIKIPTPIKVGNPDAHHTIINQIGTLEALVRNPDIKYLYMGINQNPPQPWGDPKWVFPVRPTENKNPRLVMPFMMLYKTHIIDILLQEKQERLLELTHTCTEQTSGSCGLCFQCNERKWALDHFSA